VQRLFYASALFYFPSPKLKPDYQVIGIKVVIIHFCRYYEIKAFPVCFFRR
jgi:hypothetical protein